MNLNKPNWMVIALDETRDWSDDIVAKAGKVFGIYLFDAHRQVHCAELMASYELHPIESLPRNFLDNEAEREALHELIWEGDAHCSDVKYVHCNAIDNMTMDCFVPIGHWTRYPDETYEDELAAVLEDCRCNQREPRIVAHGKQETETVQ